MPSRWGDDVRTALGRRQAAHSDPLRRERAQRDGPFGVRQERVDDVFGAENSRRMLHQGRKA